jgi:hypothetical protein
LGAAFNNGFNSADPIEFSWRPIDEISDYTLKISDSYNFPEEETRTFTIPVGNADNYVMTGEDKLAIYTLSNNSSVVRPILYWTVAPTTSAGSGITTQIRQITGKRVIKLAPNGGGVGHMTITTESGGVYKFAINGEDPVVYSSNINRIINPGASGKLTLSWAYKSNDDCRWEFFFSKPNAAGGLSAAFWLPRSDEWHETDIDIGQYMRTFAWGTATNHRLRIDPGGSRAADGESAVPKQRTVYMTNMQLNIY